MTEIIETTKIHSLSDGSLETVISDRPFRSPHHTASFIAIIGGGNKVKPGEVSLAHNGVLFLDEIPEFSRASLEALRQPLEDRAVNISRANGRVSYPAHFMLVATMNPCPCGYYGDEKKECSCSQQAILNYHKRLSGPLLDRIDMIVPVSRVPRHELFQDDRVTDKDGSAKTKNRIEVAREKQMLRHKKPNSALSNNEIAKLSGVSAEAQAFLANASEKLNLSARSHYRILRVARTIADLSNSEVVNAEHVAEALRYRQ